MPDVVTYNPSAPVQSAGAFRSVLETTFKDKLSAVLQDHMSSDRFMTVALKALSENPDLLKCTQESVVMAIMNAAELGLDVSKARGEAYLLPFGRTCQLIIGYRGKVKLARQTGEVRRIEAEVVYENDDFAYKKGTQFVLSFTPNLTGDRGQPVGAYALVEFNDGGIQSDYMSKVEIEKVRKSSRSGNSGPWKTWPDEMWKKTVFSRLWKWLPVSSALAKAQEIEHYSEPQAPRQQLPAASSLADKLKARVEDVEVEEVVEPDPDPGEDQAMVLLSEEEIRQLNIKISAAGISTREIKLQFLQSVLNEPVESTKGLTQYQMNATVPYLAAGFRMVDKIGKRAAARVWKRWAETGEEYSDLALASAYKLEEKEGASKGDVSEALYAPAE